MLPKPGKRKKADFGALLDEEPVAEAPADDYAAEEDDFSDLEEEDDLSDLDASLDEEDPLAASSDEFAPEIDPEQAALCERLGFSEPDQQQALIDLIGLVMAPPTDLGSDDMGAASAFPESAI